MNEGSRTLHCNYSPIQNKGHFWGFMLLPSVIKPTIVYQKKEKFPSCSPLTNVAEVISLSALSLNLD